MSALPSGPLKDYVVHLHQLVKAQEDMISFHEAWITSSSNPAFKAAVDKKKLSMERSTLKRTVTGLHKRVQQSSFHSQAQSAAHSADGPAAAAGLRRIKQEADVVELDDDSDEGDTDYSPKDPFVTREQELKVIAEYLASPASLRKPLVNWVHFAQQHPHRGKDAWRRLYLHNKEEIDRLVQEYRLVQEDRGQVDSAPSSPLTPPPTSSPEL